MVDKDTATESADMSGPAWLDWVTIGSGLAIGILLIAMSVDSIMMMRERSVSPSLSVVPPAESHDSSG